MSSRNLRPRSLPLVASLLTLALAPTARADVLTIGASQDNTLYQSAGGSLSNGTGDLFVGRTLQGSQALRRAVVQFDVAGALPAGSTVHSVSLRVFVNHSVAGAVDTSVHRVDQAWGEAGSGAGGGQGSGGAAASGDVTWLHTFFPGTFWTTPGGDFAAAPSATGTLNFGASTFSSPQLAADVQAWLDAPATNHGWLLKAVDEFPAPTAKRLYSRESSFVADRPYLDIDFSPPGTGTTFCNSLPNATGSEALLTATGAPGSALVFTAAPVPDTVGQFFYGPRMLGGSSLGDGIRCVGGMTTRMLPFVNAGMMMQLPNTATFAVNYTAPYAAGLVGTQYFQHWFRSGLSTGTGSGTSSGLEITF